jgi:exodeoxyribonuclease-3
MKAATWNVNSIRARVERLLAWLSRESPDVVCLQELKVTDDEFPHTELARAGWRTAVHGQKTYNGVAILAREPLTSITTGFGDGAADDEARLIGATVGGVRVLSAYVPNGKTVGSDKWAYKLEWLRRLRGYVDRNCSGDEPLLLCGDFNVAPDPVLDVARPEEWEGSVLCHEEVRALLRDLVDWGLTDTLRHANPEGPGPYTWWDYRMLGFAKGNGLRIDHILATRPLAARLERAWVDREERKGTLPSDHAPVLASFASS